MSNYNYDKIVAGFDRDQVIELMKNTLSDFRFNHCLRVEKQAIALAEKYDVDPARVGLAGLLHDFAKERSDQEFINVIKEKNLDPDLLNYGNAIWHGEVGAEIIKDELKIQDEDVLNAIRRHTVGSMRMNDIDKCVFIADYIEPGRDFPGVEEAREQADISLYAGMIAELTNTINHLVDRKQVIHPQTFETYNYWIKKGA
ncbi:bis(5'-nucleosyl)-tetraphosphatase (symmetrical) YqeK [Companilactobacillus metriopterae]|uniref:bis(5'-nucleosyl)-tetraphosphatase (symmetrical) YqeK n=1 Tax=Companilactobacillus metriopterae TaxID=1909267 RepID=UPI001F511EF1|nr:bis(5'-nucleosyl)-tetraphosphatase (symmetrical) YqeK [Companilactobacillus metriopterae]